MTKITKILIANRGEIAVRIMRTAKKMGIATVAIFANADRNSLHVTEADELVCIGEVELSETYLNIEKIVSVAKETGCDAIHPGYGFLAENPLFVEACDAAGIIFIGPRAEAMRVMGNKIGAREFVKKAGVPVTEGLTGSRETLLKAKSKIGFPVLLKAAAGGGGKGMQIVRKEKDLEAALESTARQAKAYFGDDTIYIEKYLDEPRHIEFQIMGDHHGNVVHVFERECSIQRRYQKIIEESPSPTLTPELRKEMGESAVRIGEAIGYTNAGTIEFLVDKDLHYYFLEMNTRIQVEHPVTEMVTGLDLVEEQIRIAEGQPMRMTQEDLRQNGHSIECRIYAEDPEHNFLPSPGKMTFYHEPVMDHIRIDKGIRPDAEITSSYDPMICKLVSWGTNREEARIRMMEALGQYCIHGIRTNIAYLAQLLSGQPFITNTISTKFCDEHTPDIIAAIQEERKTISLRTILAGYLLYSLRMRNARESSETLKNPVWNEIGYWREQPAITLTVDKTEIPVRIISEDKVKIQFNMDGQHYNAVVSDLDNGFLSFILDGDSHSVFISEDENGNGQVSSNGHLFLVHRKDFLPDTIHPVRFESSGNHGNEVTAPMPGKVIKIFVRKDQEVKKGEVLLILEAMKMENSVEAPFDALIGKIEVAVDDRVDPGKVLFHLDKKEKTE
jgi:3-methylcrotonyl-CoA carboxylase alpha subunit